MKLTSRQKDIIIGLIMQEITRYGGMNTINIHKFLNGYTEELRELNYIIANSLDEG